jgi:hypothetical protein
MSSIPTESEERRRQARHHSSEATWADAQEHLDPSDSSHDLPLRLRPSEKSLLTALQHHLLSHQQDRHKRRILSRMRRAFSKRKPQSLEKFLFRLHRPPPLPRAPPPTPESRSNRPRPSLSCGLPVTMRRLVLQKRPQQGKFLTLPCLSQDRRQRLPSEDSQLSAPILPFEQTQTMSNQVSW